MTAASDKADPRTDGEWVRADARYARIAGTDPYTEWALDAGKGSFFPSGRQQRWLPVLVRLNGISPRDFADGQHFVDDGQSLAMWRASVRVSPLYIDDRHDRRQPYCTAMVRPGFFEFMKRSRKLRESVARITIGLPLDSESLPTADANRDSGNGQP